MERFYVMDRADAAYRHPYQTLLFQNHRILEPVADASFRDLESIRKADGMLTIRVSADSLAVSRL